MKRETDEYIDKKLGKVSSINGAQLSVTIPNSPMRDKSPSKVKGGQSPRSPSKVKSDASGAMTPDSKAISGRFKNLTSFLDRKQVLRIQKLIHSKTLPTQ